MKNLIRLSFLVIIVSTSTLNLSAQTHLVKNINPNSLYNYSIQVCNHAQFDGSFYFVATSQIYAPELWKTNGTLGSTVKINLLPNDGGVYRITEYNNSLIFAGEGPNGIELWKSDGTQGGTTLIKDLSPGTGSGDPCNFKIVNGVLFFTGNFNGLSFELWKTDGTSEGTELVKNIPATMGGELTDWFFATDDLLIFMAQNLSSRNMWRSDGTEGGTYQLEDGLGNIPENVSIPISQNNSVYFTATTTGFEDVLWVTDGSFSGTQRLTDNQVISITSSEDAVFFIYNDPTDGKTFWKTDGTLAGTLFVMDPFSPSEDSFISPFSVHNDSLLYQYSFPPAYHAVPIVYDLNSQTSDTIQNCNLGDSYYQVENLRLFSAISTTLYHGQELGYLEDTVYTELNDIYPGSNMSEIKFLDLVNNLVYFTANDGVNGIQLWAIDTLSLASWRVSEIGRQASGSEIESTCEFNGKLFFSANDGTNGNEPWVSDGTESGTQMIKDILPGTSGSFVLKYAELNGELYFFTQQPSGALYKTDGTESGTILIKDIDYSGGNNYCILNGELYFSGRTNSGFELWKTDGTSGGTVLVKDIYVGIDESNPINLITIGNSVFFMADDGNGRKWWISDGTEIGTQIANPSDTDPQYSAFTLRKQANGNDLIVGSMVGNTAYLFSLNASSTNATLLSQFDGYSEFGELIVNGDYAYMTFSSDVNQKELWRVNLLDNTPTLLLTSNSWALNLISIGDTIYFTHWTSSNKWYGITNSITEPFFASECTNIAPAAIEFMNQLCFTGAYTYPHESPFILQQNEALPLIDPNLGVGAVGNKTAVENKLFFCGKTEQEGYELWVYDQSEDTIPRQIIDTTVCGSYYCEINDTEYFFSGFYFDTIPNISNQDSLILIFNLTVNYSIPAEITVAPFIFPTEEAYCSGILILDVGTANFYARIDDDIYVNTTTQTSEVLSVGGLCHGIHTLNLSDSCGYDYFSYFVIPYPNEAIYNLSGGEVLDSLGFITENCVILYDQIDTAFISSVSISDSIATVIWTITDSLGNDYFETATYNLTNGIGNYIFQISLYCPTKSVENVFAITQDVYGEMSVPTLSGNLFSLYPNPANDFVAISFSGNQAELTIYDAQGKLIQNLSAIHSGEQVSLQEVETGVYFFEITTDKGTSVKRIVKN